MRKRMRLINTYIILFLININYYINVTISRETGSRNFVGFRINSINQRPCLCPSTITCSCCESVKIFYTSEEKRLCFNMIYQKNGLNLELTLDSLIMKSITIANYKPLKMCSNIPGLLFSSICVRVLELNPFLSSITVCPRVEVLSKKERWHITYTCSSISTILSTVAITTVTMMPAKNGMISTVKPGAINTMTSSKPAMNMISTTVPGMIGIMPGAIGIMPNLMGMLSGATAGVMNVITGLTPTAMGMNTSPKPGTISETMDMISGIKPAIIPETLSGSISSAMTIASGAPKMIPGSSMNAIIGQISSVEQKLPRTTMGQTVGVLGIGQKPHGALIATDITTNGEQMNF